VNANLAFDAAAQGVWHMDEATWSGGGATVLDSLGSRHGTPAGDANTTAGSAVGARCGGFDGNGDYVAIPSFNLPGDFTVSVWFNTRSESRSAIVSSDDGSGYYTVEINGNGSGPDIGRAAFVVNDGVLTRTVATDRSDLNDGRWHNLTAVRRGTQIHLYVDGVRRGTSDVGTFGSVGNGAPYVGRRGSAGTDYFNGLIDELAIWSRALSEAEIGDVIAAGTRAQGGGSYISATLDAGMPAIWQYLSWTPDAPYSRPLSGLDSSLAALWRFEETANPVTNSVGSNDGTVNGAMFGAAGRFAGRCLSFDGAGDYVTVNHAANLTPAAISVEAWVSMDEVLSRCVVDKSGGGAGYVLGTDAAGRPYFRVGGSTCAGFLPVRAGRWTHLCGTYDGARIMLYVDGDPVGVLNQIGLSTASGANLLIGRFQGGSGDFDGLIDEVAVHNRALTQQEVFDHYRAGALTLRFQARASNNPSFAGVNFTGPGGLTNTYFTEFYGDDMLGDVPLARYFQFRVEFGTEDSRLTPKLSGVKVFVSSYPDNNPYVEPVAGMAAPFLGYLLGFDHARTFNPNTDVQYQISADGGANPRWFYWDGYQWTQETGLGYGLNTSSRDTINARILSFYPQLYDKTGGVFRFRAFLNSSGDQQIQVDSVSLRCSPGRIVVTSPNGTENGDDAWVAGVPYTVTWTWAGSVSASLAVEYSLNGTNGPWTAITNAAPRGAGGNGSVEWRTPEVDLRTNCLVRVRDPGDATIWDMSDSAFTIIRRIRVRAPNGGEKWYAGKTTNIVWEAPFNISSVMEIDYAPDGINYDISKRIAALANSVSGVKTNVYVWDIPPVGYLSTGARIRVRTAGAGEYGDESDGLFELAGIVITQPTAGRKVKRNDPFTITWESVGAGPAVAIDFSADGGMSYSNIYASVTNTTGTNSFVWNVTQDGTDHAKLRIRSLSDPNVEGFSDEFTLADIDVTAPDGGEIWLMDTTNVIQWTSGGAGPTVSIDYSTNSGASWMPIASAVSNSGSYVWTVSRLVSKHGRVRVMSDGSGPQSDTNLWSMSAADFNIAGVRVTYPDLVSHTIEKGVPTIVYHDGAPDAWAPGGVRIEISYDQAATFTPLVSPPPASIVATNWTMGAAFQFIPAYPSTRTKIRVTVNNPAPYTNVYDLSDQYFTTAGMLILAPTSNDIYNIGAMYQVRWVSAGAGDVAYIYYSNQGTNNFMNITPAGVANNQVYPGLNSYNWNVPGTLLPSTNARLRVVSGSYNDISPAFTLRGIRITSPNTGSVWNAGSPQAISWVYAGVDINARMKIDLSTDGGASYPYSISTNFPLSTMVFPWTSHPDYDPTTNAVLRMTVVSSPSTADVGVVAYSDVFTLKGLKVKEPAAGVVWRLGGTNRITFVAAAAGSEATISYSPNGGSSYESLPVAASLPIVNGSNSLWWAVEPSREPSTNAMLRVAGTAHTGYSPVFSIGGVKVTRPFQYDIWAVGETNLISWISVGTHGTNRIELMYDGYPTFLVTNGYVGTTLNWLVSSNAIPGGLDTISNVVLRVRDTGGFEGYSQPFKMVSKPRIEIVAPAAGEFWKVGETKTIRWLKGGQMQADQFKIFWSRDNFATIHGEVLGAVNFNPLDNVFSVDWDIPDQLGTTRIMVTNTFNSLVWAVSEPFDVCGNFRVIYPNGEVGEPEAYALNTVNASWGTRGSATNVDLYYRHGTGGWTKINSAAIPNNGSGLGEQITAYAWTLPNVQTTTAVFRVQDSRYTNIFDGATPGPYDDSDAFFPIKYYAVYWDVYYIDDFGRTNRLDKLSVADSSGWSQSSLSAKNADGSPAPILHMYPYGIYDTQWYREFFHDYVDFHWVCDSNHLRRVRMRGAEVEPEYHVLASFAYDVSNRTFTIHSWLERNGAILPDPSKCTIRIYTADGSLIETLEKTTHDQNGVFWQVWDVGQTEARLGVTFSSTDVFFAKVEIDFSGTTYSAGLTFALRLAAAEEQVAAIEAIVAAATANILSGVHDVKSNVLDVGTSVSAMRGEMQAGFSNLVDMGSMTTNLLGAVREDIVLMTNAILPGMEILTNEVLVLSPAISNLNASITNLSEDVVSERARILTRPTTLAFGSTNTFLYKTRPGYGASVVALRVLREDQTEVFATTMAEISPGLGIYEQTLVADWGTNSFIISCSDPLASDSMIVTVTAGGALESVPGLIQAVASQLDTVESQVTNITRIVQGMGGVDLSGVMSGIEAIRKDISGIGETDLSALDRMVSEMGTVGDDASLNTFFGRLAKLERMISSAGVQASDAARKAQTAKTEAASAASGIQALKAEIAKGDVQAALARLDEIKSALAAAQKQVDEIPQVVRLGTLYDQLRYMAERIEELAKSGGWDYLVNLEEPAEAEGGAGVSEDAIGALNRNIEEVRGSLNFMQKLMDKMVYEPVVTEQLLAAP